MKHHPSYFRADLVSFQVRTSRGDRVYSDTESLVRNLHKTDHILASERDRVDATTDWSHVGVNAQYGWGWNYMFFFGLLHSFLLVHDQVGVLF